MSFKECRDCGQVKPATEFWKRKASPDGLALYCKECFGLRNAASYRGTQAQRGKKTRPYRRHSAVPEGMKYCARCSETKSVDEFGSNRAHKSGLADYCRKCHNAAMAEGKRRNHGSQRNYLLKLRYGLTGEEVESIVARQGGVCVICLRGNAKHVDHSHLTGVVRGVLCFKCNSGMGQFGDDPVSLRRAADYLPGKLVAEVPAAGGGVRLSFTVPDVDPATVPVDGREGHRAADGRHRGSAWRVEDDHEGPTWLDRCLRELLDSYTAPVEGGPGSR